MSALAFDIPHTRSLGPECGVGVVGVFVRGHTMPKGALLILVFSSALRFLIHMNHVTTQTKTIGREATTGS